MLNSLVFNQQKDLLVSHASVKSVIQYVLEAEKRHTDEVAVYFVTTDEICKLHADFFNDPSTTDCISFPMDNEEDCGYHVLGEVFICPKTAIDYVAKEGDPYRELTLYLVHGLLHLLGYDDIEENDREQMRAAEKRIMDPLIHQKILITS